MRAYLDSCIVIYQVEEVDPWATHIASEIAHSRDPRMVVSHLVRLECRVLPLRNDDANLVRRFDIAFDAAEFVPMPPEVFDLAAELRARNRIKTPDALHLAAAIHNGCDEFWTNDDRLASLNDRIAMRVFR